MNTEKTDAMSKDAMVEALQRWSADEWREALLHAPDLAERLQTVLQLPERLQQAWHLGFDATAEGQNAERHDLDAAELEAWAKEDTQSLLRWGDNDAVEARTSSTLTRVQYPPRPR